MAHINIIEPFTRLNPISHVSTSPNIITCILRTLSGTVIIENIPNEKKIDLRKYCNTGIPNNDSCYIGQFPGYIPNRIANNFFKAISEDITVADYKRFSEIATRSNITFFETLYSEILYCIWNKYDGKNINTFRRAISK